ncbi:MAG TPA: adenylate/guanylate cyclase domain-containing protein [Mycobacterium sp.]|nr:adenylate/guanylate cyclase domain-containing protein [Mycobacterium sp.]
MSVADSVAAALEGRARLLVFDNCEHILDAAADMIETIFAHSSTVAVLATSREGLRLSDEQLWPVPSLDVRAGADSAAATLFIDRAQAVSPDVSLAAPDEASVVVEICHRLDGIPLAIELAASRMMSMTVTEVRDRLDDRFRLLVGSRRGLERHQTLRHAVQWSHDLLGDAEKTLLARCSVFAGGFDLAGAAAVAAPADELATLDMLDSLVRKSLVVADRTSGRTRFAMLETIRQFAEEQLVASGEADMVRDAHARYFARLETEVMTLWDSPRQRDSFDWFTVELPNLRAAFRWAADRHDLDTAAAIAVFAIFLGYFVEQWEPIAWAEELIPHAEAVQHPRLAQLYTSASYCAALGRVDDFVTYAAAAKAAIQGGHFDDVSDELSCAIGAGYNTTGQPKLTVEWCRATVSRDTRRHMASQAVLVIALAIVGATGEAIEASKNLRAFADSASNPSLAAAALLGYGWAHRGADPAGAYEALRRAWTVTNESGNRQLASVVAMLLSRLAATHGKLADAFDYITQTIRHYHDSGSVELVRNAFGVLATLLDGLGCYESAATISGFAAAALGREAFPEIDTTIAHLREVLGDQDHDALARVGKETTHADMVAYAFEQIDRARADLLPDKT